MGQVKAMYTDLIETAVLNEIDRYNEGVFSDADIVMIQNEAVEICMALNPFSPDNNRVIIQFLVSRYY